jgi:hypothetical protein
LTSDGGLLAYRELDEALGLFESISPVMSDGRTGRNIQHDITILLRQSVYSRLAGYEDVNDAKRLSIDPVMRAVTGKKKKNAASVNTIGRFETEILPLKKNLKSLSEINGRWVEGAMLRPGNVHSADCWKELLKPIVRRYENKQVRKYFRGDAAFAKPEIYEYLEEKSLLYAISLPANDLLYDEIKHLLMRPVGRPSRKPVVWFHEFKYQAASWQIKRRVVVKVEWYSGDLFPRIVFIVTNMSAKAEGVVRFYNGRGIAEQRKNVKNGEGFRAVTKLNFL